MTEIFIIFLVLVPATILIWGGAMVIVITFLDTMLDINFKSLIKGSKWKI